MATQTTESSLDELAKGLATGTPSRGKAIRWMGGALLERFAKQVVHARPCAHERLL